VEIFGSAATPPEDLTGTPEAEELASLISQLGSEALFDISRAARLELARQCGQAGDILGWGRALFPRKFEKPSCTELHQYLVDTRGEEHTCEEAPRGFAKSFLRCNLIPLFQGIHEPDKFQHYLNAQSTTIKALATNTGIKLEFESNEDLLELYGDLVGKDKWTDSQFVLRNGVVYSAVGAGESIRGYNYRNIRPDYIVIDDIYGLADIHNMESTRTKASWFWGEIYPARAAHRRCSVHVIGTAINDADLLKELQGKKGWKSRTFKAIKDWGNREAKIEPAVLWPEFMTFEKLTAELENTPSTIWFRERQNERRDETEAIIKKSWLYPADAPSWEFDPATLKWDNHNILESVILGVDPSIGAKHDSDFTGVVLVYKTRFSDSLGKGGHRWYIMGIWNERLSLDERVKLLERICERQPNNLKVRQCRIEGIGGFKDFAAEAKRRTNVPILEIDHVSDKVANLENHSHFFQNGKVFLNKNISPALKDLLVYQLTTTTVVHDDIRDALLLTIDDAGRKWDFVG
jgi:hypothetical protein